MRSQSESTATSTGTAAAAGSVRLSLAGGSIACRRTRGVGTHGVDDNLIALFQVFAEDFDQRAVIQAGPHDHRRQLSISQDPDARHCARTTGPTRGPRATGSAASIRAGARTVCVLTWALGSSALSAGSAGSGLVAGVLRVGQALMPLPVVRAWRALIMMVVVLLAVVSLGGTRSARTATGGTRRRPGHPGSSRTLRTGVSRSPRAGAVRSGSNFA